MVFYIKSKSNLDNTFRSLESIYCISKFNRLVYSNIVGPLLNIQIYPKVTLGVTYK